MGLTYNTLYSAPRTSTKTSYTTSPINQDKDEYEKMIQSQLASGSGAELQQQTTASDGTVTNADAPPPPETSTYDDSRYTDGNFIEGRDLTGGMEAGVDGLGDFQQTASEEDPMATRVNDGSGAESLLDDPNQSPNLNFIDTGMDGVKETELNSGSGAESMLDDPMTAPDPTAGAGAGGGAGMSGGPGDNANIDELVVQRLKDLLGEGPRDTSEAERAANWRATGRMRQHMGRMAAGGFGASGASGRLGGMIEMDRVGAIDDIQRQAQQDYENRVLQGLGVNIGYENLQDRRHRAEMMNTILQGMLNPEDTTPEGDGGGGDGGGAGDVEPDILDPGTWGQGEFDGGSNIRDWEDAAKSYEEGGAAGVASDVIGDPVDAARLALAQRTPDAAAALSAEEGTQLAASGWQPLDGKIHQRMLDGKKYRLWQGPDGSVVAVLI